MITVSMPMDVTIRNYQKILPLNEWEKCLLKVGKSKKADILCCSLFVYYLPSQQIEIGF